MHVVFCLVLLFLTKTFSCPYGCSCSMPYVLYCTGMSLLRVHMDIDDSVHRVVLWYNEISYMDCSIIPEHVVEVDVRFQVGITCVQLHHCDYTAVNILGGCTPTDTTSLKPFLSQTFTNQYRAGSTTPSSIVNRPLTQATGSSSIGLYTALPLVLGVLMFALGLIGTVFVVCRRVQMRRHVSLFFYFLF